MWFTYNLLIVLAAIVMMPKFIKRLFKEKGFSQRFFQGFGCFSRSELKKVANKHCLWVHAASVGEVVAASSIVRELRSRYPESKILFSVITVTGYSMAKKIIPEANAFIYLPLDFWFLSKRIVRMVMPRVLVIVETEIWPNLLRYCRTEAVPVVMVNGRIGSKSLRQYQWIKCFIRRVLLAVNKFCMQSGLDAERIVAIGADPERVAVTGNTKYEQNYTEIDSESILRLKAAVGVIGRYPVIVAGSTYEGEENQLFEAFIRLKGKFSSAAMIIAPRKIDRTEKICELASQSSLTVCRRTALAGNESSDVIVLDTIGELGRMYGLADIVFVGGSLIMRGGHNILEPAAHGKPIIVGPNMNNFAEIYQLFVQEKACITVSDSGKLAEIFLKLAEAPDICAEYSNRALGIIEKNSGASTRCVDEIEKIIQK